MNHFFKKLCAGALAAAMLTPAMLVNVSAATYIWPLDSDNNYITSYAGGRIHPLTGKSQDHSGIDIRAAKGEDVYATAEGTAYIGCNWCDHNYGKSKSCGCGGGYGNYIYIVHPNGMVSYYAHLTRVLVSEGEYVTQGERIGTVGSTGSSTGYHLHFEMRTSTSRDDRQDPLDYVSIPGEDSGSSETYTPETPSYNNGSNVYESYTGMRDDNAQQNTSNVYDYYDPFATPKGNDDLDGSSGSTGNDVVIPEETQGSIRIGMTDYPEALKEGKSCNLKGTITAGCELTRVTGRILDANGNGVQSAVAYPDEDSLNIYRSNLNKKLRFGTLSAGSYILKIDAEGKDGSTCTWQKAFTVGDVSAEGGSSSSATNGVSIELTRYPKTIDRGDSFSLRGTISSDARIRSIKGYILDEDGDEVQTTTDSVSSRSVDIRSRRLNQKLAFGKLSRGTYTLKVVATDADGKTATWEKKFVVE